MSSGRDQHPNPLTPTVWLCRHAQWWRAKDGLWICEVCHPPALEELVYERARERP